MVLIWIQRNFGLIMKRREVVVGSCSLYLILVMQVRPKNAMKIFCTSSEENDALA